MLMLLKEGGSLDIDTIGNLPIDEDLDLLPDVGGAVGSMSIFDMLYYNGSYFTVSSTVPGPSVTTFVNKTKHFYSLNGEG